ncbi:MAG: hypothetical protein R3F16_08255 [Myxococcota bacterium]
MGDVPVLDPSEAPRARRWDALVLGSGLPALVAAARIGSAGQRVLVVEEAERTTLPPALKEPFFLGGLRDEGVLDACLRTLTVPLIDRRRLVKERLAYQIAADPYRLDIGNPMLTTEELVAWGLAKPDDAQTLVRRLIEASEIERQLLLEAPFARIGRRLPGTRGAPAVGHHKRGLPGDASSARGPLARVLASQVRALSNLGRALPTPEAQARLLGLGLAGGVGFADEPPWLIDLLRKRVTAQFGDIRTLTGRLELVSVSGQPGIRLARTGELWLGRAMLLGAAPSALHDLYGEDRMHPAPDLLATKRPRAYRAVFLFRVPTSLLPEGMGARLILPGRTRGQDVDGPPAGLDGPEPDVTVTAFPCQTHPRRVDLVARAVIDEQDPARLAERLPGLRRAIGERLRALMPFVGDELQSVELDMPRWDSDDGWLEDPGPGAGWPGEIDLRLSARPPIYHLDRAAVAGLGLEGDLLLGWRGGDAIAAELA